MHGASASYLELRLVGRLKVRGDVDDGVRGELGTHLEAVVGVAVVQEVVVVIWLFFFDCASGVSLYVSCALKWYDLKNL